VVTGGWVFAAVVAAVILALGFVAAHWFCARAFSAPGSSGTPAWRLAVWTGTIATRPAVRTRSCKRTPPGTTPTGSASHGGQGCCSLRYRRRGGGDGGLECCGGGGWKGQGHFSHRGLLISVKLGPVLHEYSGLCYNIVREKLNIRFLFGRSLMLTVPIF
jgi:hypothetical protein